MAHYFTIPLAQRWRRVRAHSSSVSALSYCTYPTLVLTRDCVRLALIRPDLSGRRKGASEVEGGKWILAWSSNT